MSKFAEKAASTTGIVSEIDGNWFVVQSDGQSQSFRAEGVVTDELGLGNEVTVITWGNPSAVRVVNHTNNTIYRPYYNSEPEGGDTLAEANRSKADVPEGRMGLASLLPAVFMATLFQSIPLYGWFVSYRMFADADKSILGTAPQYASQARGYFLFFIVLALCASAFVFLTTSDVLKTVLLYMTLVYWGTYMLMRIIFRGIEEIDAYTGVKVRARNGS